MFCQRLVAVAAVACALCVVLIFLYPLATGPFPVVRGPATANRARQAADLIFAWILACSWFIIAHISDLPGVSPLILAGPFLPDLRLYLSPLSVLRC